MIIRIELGGLQDRFPSEWWWYSCFVASVAVVVLGLLNEIEMPLLGLKEQPYIPSSLL